MLQYRFLSGPEQALQNELNSLKNYYYIDVVSMVKKEHVVTLLLKLIEIEE